MISVERFAGKGRDYRMNCSAMMGIWRKEMVAMIGVRSRMAGNARIPTHRLVYAEIYESSNPL